MLFFHFYLIFCCLCADLVPNDSSFFAGRAFPDKVDRLKLAEIVKQAIEEKTNLQESH